MKVVLELTPDMGFTEAEVANVMRKTALSIVGRDVLGHTPPVGMVVVSAVITRYYTVVLKTPAGEPKLVQVTADHEDTAVSKALDDSPNCKAVAIFAGLPLLQRFEPKTEAI